MGNNGNGGFGRMQFVQCDKCDKRFPTGRIKPKTTCGYKANVESPNA